MLGPQQNVGGILLLAAIVLLFGCTKPERAKITPPPAVTPELHPVPATRSVAPAAVVTRLQQTGRMLEELISNPNNAVPDAILNRTACFAVFPQHSNTTVAGSGFASCRNDNAGWTSPAVVILSNPVPESVPGDLLLFILSESASRALIDSKLVLGVSTSVARGALEREHATLDPVEVGKDAFAYVHAGNTLRGMDLVRGSVELDERATAALYGHPILTRALLDKSTLSSTVTSFFNSDVSSFFSTITPAGIIIHHSVLMPAKELPEPERAVDRFHYSRGFEISCFGKIYHIAYHYLILPNGDVRAGRPERCEGAHARGYNSYLGIALVGSFSSSDNPRGRKGPGRPTVAQMRSLVRLCRQLREKYNIPLQRIMPHSQVSQTECPGDRLDFSKILSALAEPSSNTGL